jgi:hypothetical protein
MLGLPLLSTGDAAFRERERFERVSYDVGEILDALDDRDLAVRPSWALAPMVAA